MSAYYTPILTGAPVNAATVNNPLQQLDNAIQDVLEWRSFNVKAYPFNAAGNDSSDDYQALTDALDAAANWAVGTARGGLVEIPAGIYRHSQTLDLDGFERVRVEGKNPSWGATQYGASVLKAIFDNADAIDLSNTANVTLEKLSVVGAGGTNLAHRAIYASTVTNLRLYELNIDNFGGAAIKIDAGLNKFLKHIQNTNCMLGYAGLGARAGVVQLGGTENHLWDKCNFNGPGSAFGTSTTGNYGSGYLVGLYITGNPVSINGLVVAFAQEGIVLTGTDAPATYVNLRVEYIQGNGIVVEGNRHTFEAPQLFQVGLAADDTYYGVKFSGNNALDNTLIVPLLDALGSAPNQAKALLYDNVSSPHGIKGANRVVSPGFGFNNKSSTNGWVEKSGTNPLIVSGGLPYHQTLTDAATVDINAALGDYWDLTTANSRTIAAPTKGYKGQRAIFAIKNSSAGSITTTFNSAFKLSGWTDPAAGKTRVLDLECYDGTNWRMLSLTGDLTI